MLVLNEMVQNELVLQDVQNLIRLAIVKLLAEVYELFNELVDVLGAKYFIQLLHNLIYL